MPANYLNTETKQQNARANGLKAVFHSRTFKKEKSPKQYYVPIERTAKTKWHCENCDTYNIFITEAKTRFEWEQNFDKVICGKCGKPRL